MEREEMSITERGMDMEATMKGAGCDEAQIPYGPPNRVLFEASGAYPWALVIQIIGTNTLATE